MIEKSNLIEKKIILGTQMNADFQDLKYDGIIKSRHSGGNRSPENF